MNTKIFRLVASTILHRVACVIAYLCLTFSLVTIAYYKAPVIDYFSIALALIIVGGVARIILTPDTIRLGFTTGSSLRGCAAGLTGCVLIYAQWWTLNPWITIPILILAAFCISLYGFLFLTPVCKEES